MAEKTSPQVPLQQDMELSALDYANRAVREYQAGKCTTAYVRARLKAIEVHDLELVALATRLTVRTLTQLRG